MYYQASRYINAKRRRHCFSMPMTRESRQAFRLQVAAQTRTNFCRVTRPFNMQRLNYPGSNAEAMHCYVYSIRALCISRYGDDPTIMAWVLINEPRCYQCGSRIQVLGRFCVYFLQCTTASHAALQCVSEKLNNARCHRHSMSRCISCCSMA